LVYGGINQRKMKESKASFQLLLVGYNGNSYKQAIPVRAPLEPNSAKVVLRIKSKVRYSFILIGRIIRLGCIARLTFGNWIFVCVLEKLKSNSQLVPK